LIWLARSGARWRDIPARYGSYAAIKVRYYQWVLEKIAQTPDMEWLMVDATHIRVHSQAAGARHKRGELKSHGIGHSKGGLTSKIHMAYDGVGLAFKDNRHARQPE